MSNREPNDLDSYSDYIDGPDEDMTGLLRDPDYERDSYIGVDDDRDLEERINEAEYKGGDDSWEDPAAGMRDEDYVHYSGSLISDCKAVEALGKSLEAKLSAPLPEGLFEKARRLNAEQAPTVFKADSSIVNMTLYGNKADILGADGQYHTVELGTVPQNVMAAFDTEFSDGKQEARERLMGYDRNAESNYSEFGR